MFRRVLGCLALVVPLAVALPATPAAAAPNCQQAPQLPYTPDGLTIWWGTMVICDMPIQAAILSGALTQTNGVPIMTVTGPAVLGPGPWPVPGPQSLFFWSNPAPCVASTYYHTAMLSVVLVAVDGTVASLGPQGTGDRLINCL
jgi:hypothetical protein